MSSEVRAQRDGDVAVVTMDRASRRNAGNLALWRALADIFASLAADGTRLAILTGAGGHFCAGNDILDYEPVRGDREAEDAWMASIAAAYAAIRGVPFPVVAAIDGACAGAGCGLAMSCDFRIATRGAYFTVPAARLGILYPVAQTRRLAAIVGLGNARRWLYGGQKIDAPAAARDGFLDALTDADPIAAAIEFARPFVDNAPLSIAGAKRMLNALVDGTLDEESEHFARLYREAEDSEDHAEAERAFAQKRAPRFIGR